MLFRSQRYITNSIGCINKNYNRKFSITRIYNNRYDYSPVYLNKLNINKSYSFYSQSHQDQEYNDPEIAESEMENYLEDNTIKMGKDNSDSDIDLSYRENNNNEESELDEESDEEIIEKEETKIKPKKFPRGSQTAQTWNKIETYRSKGEIPPIELYYKILDSYTHKNWIARSILVLEQMEELGPKTDVKCFNYILSYHNKCEDVPSILSSYQLMKQVGIKPDIKSIEILIKSAVLSNDKQIFNESLEYIDNNNLSYNLEIYLSCVEYYIINNDEDKIFEFIDKMKENNLIPDAEICNRIIYMYMQTSQLDKIQNIVDMMNEYNIKPTMETYEVTMEGYLDNGDLSEVDRLFEEMEEHFTFQSVTGFAIMIKKAFIIGNIEEATNLFKLPISQGMDLEPNLYIEMICGYCNSGQYEEGIVYFDKLMEDNISMNSESSFYLLSYFIEHNMLSQSQDLLEYLSEQPNINMKILYHKMIEFVNSQELFDQVVYWIIKLRSIDMSYEPTNEYCDQIIKGLEKQDIIITKKELFDRLSLEYDPVTKSKTNKNNSFEMEDNQQTNTILKKE